MRLLDQVRVVIRKKHYSYKTEQAYIDWIKRYIYFNGKRHPKDMGEKEIARFISHLAINRRVAASTQNQALNAIVFLYKHVLRMELGDIGPMERAKRPKKLPEAFLSHLAIKQKVSASAHRQALTLPLDGGGLEPVPYWIREWGWKR